MVPEITKTPIIVLQMGMTVLNNLDQQVIETAARKFIMF